MLFRFKCNRKGADIMIDVIVREDVLVFEAARKCFAMSKQRVNDLAEGWFKLPFFVLELF